TTTSNKAAIIRLSEDYEVLSAYTAFLASQAQVVIPGGGGGIVLPTDVREIARTAMLFDLSLRGSLLILDWKSPADVEAIRIYDLQGRILFTWKPSRGAPAIGRWVWDGRDANGLPLGRGRYLISVQTRTGIRNQVFVWSPGR
ncbi:MAG: hypothetical protein ABIW76_07820, partial [Fibrobacteria bacterium]